MNRARRKGRPRRAATALLLLAAGPSITACMNFHLIHPKQVPPGVIVRSVDRDFGDLRVHLEWASPPGPGPFPTVLVHPDAGHQAVHLRGVIWDLSEHGYLAVAADYRRRIRGRFRRTLFAWREEADAGRALEVVRADPRCDPARLVLMGFSQGGVFSLLIAERDPDVSGVVAYYPVTDFAGWFSRRRTNPFRRCVFRMIEGHFRRKSGARDEEEFQRILARASPYRHAESLRAPVLLVHGDADTTASVEESRRMAVRLLELGRDVELVEVPGAGHVFNFFDETAARRAWEATLAFIDRHVAAPEGQAP